MPDLPGSSVQLDEEMFYYVLNKYTHLGSPTTKFTVIQKWFESGEYVPFTAEQLMELLVKAKCHVPPWIRLNRVIRDIPNQYILVTYGA